MRRFVGMVSVGLYLAAVGCANDTKSSTGGASNRVSEFGRYEGYAEPVYTQWVRESHYVTMRDGVKLAVDIMRPAQNGAAVEKAFPVVWTHSRYHRTQLRRAALEASHDLRALRKGEHPAVERQKAADTTVAEPKVVSYVDGSPSLQRLVKHGYVIVTVGVRGSDVSYGRYEGLFSPAETRDAYDVMDWMVKQSWCDGNLGMFGGSYLGITQYMAASTKHPALKAIFPTVAAFDMYDLLYSGGIYRENMMQHWGILTRNLDVNFVAHKVDEDEDGRMRDEALAQHKDNWNVIEEFRAAKFRDYDVPQFAYSRHQPSAFLNELNQSGVAAYHWGGWYDIFANDELLWLVNWTGPDRLTMGPWAHAFADSVMGAEQGRLSENEQHRWYDRWLKGIQNGVDSEPPVRYAITVDPGKWTWTSSDSWPPKGVQNVMYYFGPGKSGSVASVNDGVLSTDSPKEDGRDKYRVDLTTTTGTASRWDNAVGQGPMKYPDMTKNDAKGLTYTTAPLTADLTITGHPVVTLFVTSDQRDGDFYAILEEVDQQGVSHYVTEGMLRASHRDTAQAPWNNLGVPWHRNHAGDKKPLTRGEVVPLTFGMQPNAVVFNAGHRIRVTITGADTDNTEAPPVRGRPTIDLYRSAQHPSGIQLPVVR